MGRNTIKQLGRLAGYLIVPLTLVIAIGLISVRRFEWYILVGLIVLAAAIAFFAATNPEVWQRRLGRQRVSSTISGIVVIIALVGIIALINILMQRTNFQLDLTKNKSFTISDASVKVVQNLSGPVTAIVFYNSATLSQQQQATDLLKQFTNHSDKLTVQTINLDNDPLAVQRYAVKTNPDIVFTKGTRKEDTATVDEQSFARTLLKVQNPAKRVLVVTGHQELATQPDQQGNSLASTIQSLSDNNYKVEIYNSVTGTSTPTTPTDPTNPAAAPATGTLVQLNPAEDILLIVGPRGKFSDDEKNRFSTFFKQGGKALIGYQVTGVTDPAQATNLNDLLTDWGVKFNPGVVVETDPNRRSQQSATVLVPTASTSSEITQGFSAQDVLVVANSSSIEKSGTNQATFNQLLTTSSNSYLKVNLASKTIEFEQGDVRGPITVAASIQQKATQAAPAISATTIVSGTTAPAATDANLETRLVVLGSALSLNDALLQSGSNNTFLLNVMNFLSASGNNIVIPPKAANNPPFTVSQSQSSLSFWSSFLGIPILILFLGLAAWWRRR